MGLIRLLRRSCMGNELKQDKIRSCASHLGHHQRRETAGVTKKQQDPFRHAIVGVEVPEDWTHEFLHIRHVRECVDDCSVLDTARRREPVHKEQNQPQTSNGNVLLADPQDPLNQHFLHIAVYFVVMDVFRRCLAGKVGFLQPVPAVQCLLPVLRALHLLRHDKLPLCAHRQREIRVLLPPVRVPAQEHPLPIIRRTILFI